VPRALLYNDGGFDVSPDGSTLCACAEYWLPDDVNSAMELLQREELVEEPHDEDGMPTDDATSTLTPENQTTPENSPSRHSMTTRSGSMPVTPPNLIGRMQLPPLTPPPPPGVRFSNSLGNVAGDYNEPTNPSLLHPRALSRFPPAQPNPHPLSIVSGSLEFPDVAGVSGRYVPHVVTVSLDTSPVMGDSTNPAPRYNVTSVARGYRPRLGQLLEAAPLDGSKAAAVTCVKFSPSADFCLLGYGVREPAEGGQHHPVTALYRVVGGMTHISTMLSGDDDVNIARFHPDSGYGFVYGTKQGRVRVLSPRPWNYYNY
jgi:activator-of-BECN1-regulated-autophagy protein 1